MAHSSVILDQFILIFGGYNSKAGTLISNDLYVLSLNGEHKSMLPKALEKKQPVAQAKKKAAESKTLSKKNSVAEETKDVTKDVPKAKEVTKAEPVPVPVVKQSITPTSEVEKPPVQVKEAFMEQPERMTISGQIISTLINARPAPGANKQLNLLQIVKDSVQANNLMSSIGSKQSEAATVKDA